MFIRAVDQPLIHFGKDHDNLILLNVRNRVVENEATIQLNPQSDTLRFKIN